MSKRCFLWSVLLPKSTQWRQRSRVPIYRFSFQAIKKLLFCFLRTPLLSTVTCTRFLQVVAQLKPWPRRKLQLHRALPTLAPLPLVCICFLLSIFYLGKFFIVTNYMVLFFLYGFTFWQYLSFSVLKLVTGLGTCLFVCMFAFFSLLLGYCGSHPSSGLIVLLSFLSTGFWLWFFKASTYTVSV